MRIQLEKPLRYRESFGSKAIYVGLKAREIQFGTASLSCVRHATDEEVAKFSEANSVIAQSDQDECVLVFLVPLDQEP